MPPWRGRATALGEIVEANIPGVKVLSRRPGLIQRAAGTARRKRTWDEAFLAGQAAVRAPYPVNGQDGHLLRGDGDDIYCETVLPSQRNRQRRKEAPARMDHEDGVSMNFQFLRYALPLIQGEVALPYETACPVCPPRQVAGGQGLSAYEV